MTQSGDLLRLLEPAVRPVSPVKPAAGPTGAPAGELPFEAQDFDSLLASAQQADLSPDAAEPAAEAAQAKQPGPLDALADFGRIENPGLRELLGKQRETHDPLTTIDNPTQTAA